MKQTCRWCRKPISKTANIEHKGICKACRDKGITFGDVMKRHIQLHEDMAAAISKA